VGRLFRNVDLSQQSAGGDVGEGLTSSTPLTSSSVPATDPIGLEPTYAGNGPQNLYGTSRDPEAGSGR
jgi:hypothetical protein